jgi:bacillopeptidase F (M6 metalloprotease family)
VTSPSHELAERGDDVAFRDARSDHDAIVRWRGSSSAGWVEHTVDLSAYAGDQINVRFAFSTDSSVVNPGVFIDKVTIVD